MTDLPPAFCRRIAADAYEASAATQSPWNPQAQHGGPPTALLVASIERELLDAGLKVTSVASDFLGAVPRGVVKVRTRILRPGRRVQLMAAAMKAGDRVVVLARCWCIRVVQDPARPSTCTPPPPVWRDPEPSTVFPPGVPASWQYGRANDWRFLRGGFAEFGPAQVWARTRLPLVENEPTSGLQRMVIVADSANGLSGQGQLTHGRVVVHPYRNHDHRRPAPAGEWLHLDAHPLIDGDGTGTAHAEVSDELGALGTCSQPLLIRPRTASTTT